MAKRLLLNVLVEYLGDYIHGLTEENLKLGIWSGLLEMKNLALNVASLHKLNLPLNPIEGSLVSLKVSIPWSSLESTPVRITLDGVYLLVSPIDFSTVDNAELKVRAKLARDMALLNAEKAVETAAQNSKNLKDSSSSSYFQRLTAKIVDNIEITLTNVHIRFEDSITIPGTCLSVGITLDSFTLSTTDAEWKETFVKRDTSTLATIMIHKLACLKNLGLYWNTNSNHIQYEKLKDFQNIMKKYIFTKDNPNTGIDMYFLSMPNNMTLKLLHRDRIPIENQLNTPKIDMIIESSRFPLVLEEQQVLQFLSLYNSFETSEKQKQIYLLRPEKSVKEDPKAWWLYAIRALRTHQSAAEKFQIMFNCSKYREKYIEHIRTLRQEPSHPNKQVIQSEVDFIENLLPQAALIVFRQLATVRHLNSLKDNKKSKDSSSSASFLRAISSGSSQPSTEKNTSSGSSNTTPSKSVSKGSSASYSLSSFSKSMFGSKSKSNTNTNVTSAAVESKSSSDDVQIPSSGSFDDRERGEKSDEDDVSLDVIESKFQSILLSEEKPPDFLLRLQLTSSATLKVTSNRLGVIDMVMAVTVQTEVRPSLVTATIYLDDLLVRDLYTPTPILPNLIVVDKTLSMVRTLNTRPLSMSSSSSLPIKSDPKLVVVFEGRGNDVSIDITALPCIFAWNKPCIRKLFEIFIWSSESTMTSAAFALQKSVFAAVDTSTTKIKLRAEAPKIIIPDDVSVDRGVFFLDNGNLSLVGIMSNTGMTWEIQMSSINAAICDSITHIESINERNLYLIHPFDVLVTVKDTNPDCDSSVSLFIKPEIRGELSANGLERFIRIIEMGISTVTAPAAIPVDDEEVVSSTLTSLLGVIRDQPVNVNQDAKLMVDIVDGNILTKRIDPLRVVADVNISCPCVALKLPYDTPNKDHLLLAMNDLHMHVVTRAYDMELVTVVENLRVLESQRTEEQQDLVRTPPGTKLINICYRACYTRLAPSYRGFGMEIEILFSELALNVDPTTTRHLRPYFVAIMNATDDTPIITSVTASVTSSATDIISSLPAKMASPKSPPGMLIDVRLGEVSIEFLRTPITKDFSTSYSKRSDTRVNLTSVCMVRARDFALRVEAFDRSRVRVRLKSFDITDTNDIRSDYIHRQILRPDTTTASSTVLKSDVSNNKNMKIQSNQVEDSNDDLLTVVYEEKDNNINETEVCVRDIACLISVDCVLDLVDVASANFIAAMEVLEPPKKSNATEVFEMAEQGVSSQLPEASAAFPTKPSYVAETSSVRVNVANPRIILLEDPTQATSRAVVARCGITVNFNLIGSLEEETLEENEILQISLRDLSLAVLVNATVWNPQQIIEPFHIEVLHKRNLVNKVPISMGISIVTYDINARISLNDVVLIHSIIMRATLFEATEQMLQERDEFQDSIKKIAQSNFESSLSTVDSFPSRRVIEIENQKESQLTICNVIVKLGTVAVTLINDFNSQNIPVIKAEVHEAQLTASGFPQDLEGTGSCLVTADFFNSKLGLWEPVIEPFNPEVTLTVKGSETTVGITVTHTLQLTISGQMTRTILQTYSQLMRLDDVVERETVHPLTIRNRVGLPVILSDQSNSQKLFELKPYDVAVFPPQLSQTNAVKIPNLMELRFMGTVGEFRNSVPRLPVLNNGCRCYFVDSIGGVNQSNKPIALEPVVEEIIENQRYHPSKGWTKPFMPNDPSEFTDAHGSKQRRKQDVQLPTDLWQWQDDWKISMTRKIGSEIDDEGWDYGLSFSDISTARGRRTKRIGDCVRRRRWLRTRVPLDSVMREDEASLPWSLFWDVSVTENGSRQISIFSRIRIFNKLPFAVIILVKGRSWDGVVEACEIPEHDEYSIPISFSQATAFAIKPTSQIYEFRPSQMIDCKLAVHNFQRFEDICCRAVDGDHSLPIYARVALHQSEKAFYATISPHFYLKNLLPCDISYRCLSESGSIETGVLYPGCSDAFIHTNLTANPTIAFKTGTYEWSAPYPLVSLEHKLINITLVSTENIRVRNADLMLSMVLNQKHGSKIFELFSDFTVLDKTGLGLCIRGKCPHHNEDAVNIRYLSTERIPQQESHLQKEMIKEHPSFFVNLIDLQIYSVRRYEEHPVEVNALVYTDRDLRWRYLPHSFKMGVNLTTPCDDRVLRSDKLIQFHVDQAAIVILLFDVRVKYLPSWVTREGYCKLVEQAVADRNHNGEIITVHYASYGKKFTPDDVVILGGNASRDSRGMFTVIVVSTRAPLTEKLIAQVLFDNDEKLIESKTSWVEGTYGMGLFAPRDGKAAVGIDGGVSWSDDLPISLLSSAKGRFEVVDRSGDLCYQFAYSVAPMSGIFQRTKLVTIMPHYCIVNCMDESIYIRQSSVENSIIQIEPWQYKDWHRTDRLKGTLLQFRCLNTEWSYGAIDINEVGSDVLLLPCSDPCHSDPDYIPTILHFEVKEAEPDENCFMMIVIWRARIEDGATVSIKNDSEFPVVVRQANIPVTDPTLPHPFDISVWPGKILPFGFTDPLIGAQVIVAVGPSFVDPWCDGKIINILAADNKVIQLMQGVFITVQAVGRGRVLHIVPNEDSAPSKPIASKTADLRIDINFHSIGLSLVVERPVRRELCSIYIDNMVGSIRQSKAVQSYEFCIFDLQVDNYADAARLPVLIHSAKREIIARGEKSVMADLPLLHSVLVIHADGNASSHVEYVGARLLELVIYLDSGTLEQLICDLHPDINYISWDEALATDSPARWINNYNMNVIKSVQNKQFVDVYIAKKIAKAHKIYFDNISIHPIKISLTFQKSTSKYRYKSNLATISAQAAYWLEAIPNIVSVDHMPVKLNSFIVNHALESLDTLRNRILSKLMLDLQLQSAVIAGNYVLSLSALGRPAGLAKNIGDGVQNFFYEPYEGALESPTGFVLGLGKGTSGLVSSVVSGALTSTSSIVGTASDSLSYGMAFLSSDEDYSRKRHEKRQQHHIEVARGGAFAGLKSGGESIFSGLTSGITGLVSTPIEEGRRGGAVGFLKGVGLGVIGAAVKPVLGVTDGIASITQGISTTVSNAHFIDQVRPPRVLERLEGDSSDGDTNTLRLIHLDLYAANAQAYCIQMARKNDYSDVFYSVIRLPVSQQFSLNDVIISQRQVIWRRGEDRAWICIWADMSHVSIENNIVHFVLYCTTASTKNDHMNIDCGDHRLALRLYSELYRNRSRMGNPGGCLPPDMVAQQSVEDEDSNNSGPAVKPIDDYPFGAVNGLDMGPFEGSEEALIAAAKNRIYQVGYQNPGHLDEECWRIIWNWECTHRMLQSVRCCVCLVLNSSKASIQITRFHLREGKTVLALGASGFDEESRTILPEGFVVLVSYGLRPSLMDKAHIKFDIFSTAFNATISTRANRTECTQHGSFVVGFLEKSLTDWWGKYVLLVR